MENSSFPPYELDDETVTINPSVFRMIQIFNIILFSITFILGIIGNGLVIWIAGFKMKKTVNISWCLHLAIADFIFDMILPLQITESIMEGRWPYSLTMCNVVFTILFLNILISTCFLMIISIDRCISIMCPVWSKNHRSPKLACSISSIIWSTCLLLSSPDLDFLNIVHDTENNISYCRPIYSGEDTDSTRARFMIIIRFVSMFLIPFSIIVTCYSLIVFRLRRSKSLSRSNRPLKVILTIVLCFFCFWFPFHLWPFLDILNVQLDDTIDFFLFNLVYCLGFFKSCMNPIIYVLVGRDFKKSFFKSIPFLLEKTLEEKDVSDTESQFNPTGMEAEMEDCKL